MSRDLSACVDPEDIPSTALETGRRADQCMLKQLRPGHFCRVGIEEVGLVWVNLRQVHRSVMIGATMTSMPGLPAGSELRFRPNSIIEAI